MILELDWNERWGKERKRSHPHELASLVQPALLICLETECSSERIRVPWRARMQDIIHAQLHALFDVGIGEDIERVLADGLENHLCNLGRGHSRLKELLRCLYLRLDLRTELFLLRGVL